MQQGIGRRLGGPDAENSICPKGRGHVSRYYGPSGMGFVRQDPATVLISERPENRQANPVEYEYIQSSTKPRRIQSRLRVEPLKEGSVASLLIAAVFFDGIHFLISGTALRGKIVRVIGERAFLGFFSLMSVFGIIWLSRAYGQAEYLQLWPEPQMLRPVALIVMLVAFFFVILAFTSPNPTAVGGGALLTEKEPAKGVQRITRHPLLWGIALWSFTHLVFNGDLASVIFFGTFLILAVWGPFSIDRKRQKDFGDAWNRFAGLTSNVPFQAIIEGRNSLKIGELGWWPLVWAVVFYGLFLYFHQILFGRSPLPM